VLVNPDILILDDALSAVDARTETAILSRLLELRRFKTTIIAAHRLSQVQWSHTIAVLHGGQITEMGNHQQLMAQNSWYRNMYDRQMLESALERESLS
jgi:ATP-binding cassette subfamily B protein